MKFTFAIVLLSTLARVSEGGEGTDVGVGWGIVGDTFKRLREIVADNVGERGNKYLRRLKKDNDSVSFHGETIDECDDSMNWNHGSYSVASKRSGNIKIHVPQDTQIGDTLFLFLRLTFCSGKFQHDLLPNPPSIICQSRTDGFLPIRLDQWTRGAECFKSNNDQDDCLRASDCIQEDGPYCLKFRRGNRLGEGKDLSSIMFYRKVTEDDPGCWNIELRGNTTTWAVITAITNVNEQRPIVSAIGASCDNATDSVFPSVYGRDNDVLLLSQSFDDTASESDFKPPDGTSLLGWTRSDDEVSYIRGSAGKLITGGQGGPKCKDALVSVVVNRAK
ncbi:LOW QUALITY PROTEIN: hypothetical protein ACHAW5_006742 [Stephanodiscus triporus]|uniref:Uncharacterized protein n=1 Tax=Stephanodiscus triporus TaxID=2934178 RepID=A0ABD3PWF6_9STRA